MLTAAINALIADGTYARTLEQWKLTPESIPVSKTNPARACRNTDRLNFSRSSGESAKRRTFSASSWTAGQSFAPKICKVHPCLYSPKPSPPAPLPPASALSGAAFAQAFDLSPEQAARPHTTKSDAVVSLISPDYKFANPGKLTVAITLGSPRSAPMRRIPATPVGGRSRYRLAAGRKVRLELNLVPVAWPDWPLGVISGKYDAVISNVTVTEERKEKLDFSSYRKDVLGFYVKADSPITSIKEPKDAAGLKLITGSGTNQEKILLEWDKENQAAGLKPIEFQYYDDQAAAQLAIASGRADGEFDPNSSLALLGGDEPRHEAGRHRLGRLAADRRHRRDHPQGSRPCDAFTAAVNEIIADGTYAAALKRWSLDAEAVDTSETNPPGPAQELIGTSTPSAPRT